jgi:CBS domain-containing protein
MIVSDLRYLPLVDETDRPVGIVSSRDIIDYMAMKFGATGEP